VRGRAGVVAGIARARHVVVDDAVAVVVEVVAGFGAGAGGTDALDHAVLTLECARPADADVGAAGAAQARHGVVDLAVAVVVEAVALLGARPDCAVAHRRAADAAQDARRADAAAGVLRKVAGRTIRGARLIERRAQVVIDDAVAIVIGAVAGLGLLADARVA